MGFNNGYESGYSDALEDVRSGKIAGVGPASGGGGDRKKYTAVLIAANSQPTTSKLDNLPEEDVLKVTMEDLGVDSASSDPQTVDFNRIADKLAPVVAFDIFWSVSTSYITVTGPAGYNWPWLELNVSPGTETNVALSAAGDTYALS